MASYDAENCAEKERTIVARKKADAILAEVTRQHTELIEDKDEISRLRQAVYFCYMVRLI